MPRTLAFGAVQRHTVALRSMTRSTRVQHSHGCFRNWLTATVTRPFSTLAQVASLRVSTGHLPLPRGLGLGVVLVVPQALVNAGKSRLRVRKRLAITIALRIT